MPCTPLLRKPHTHLRLQVSNTNHTTTPHDLLLLPPRPAALVPGIDPMGITTTLNPLEAQTLVGEHTPVKPLTEWFHGGVFPNERLRFEWVQGCSYPHRVYTRNESGWTRREQEQIVGCCRVIRVGNLKTQMSVGLAQEWCTRHVECAGTIGVVLSTAAVENGR